MHHNDLNCGQIVDNFCYIPISHFVLLKTWLGGAMLASFGPLVQNMG